MHKLVILIPPLDDWLAFEQGWPQFLALAEDMPGLRREATSPVARHLHGDYDIAMIHEMYFDSLDAAARAMSSPSGQAAGKVLQTITAGQVTLLLADHLQDDLENIRRYTQDAPHADSQRDA